MATGNATKKLAADVIIRLAVLALLVVVWRPWESRSSALTWILGALILFGIILNVRMLAADVRALIGARREGGDPPSSARN
jgi:hypothetical protein